MEVNAFERTIRECPSLSGRQFIVSSLALGGSHCVVEVLDDTLDKILTELEVTKVVERCEKLEMFHEPC